MSQQFLKMLTEGLAAVDLACAAPPDTPPRKEGEMIIGEITDPDVRRLWLFRDKYMEEARARVEQMTKEGEEYQATRKRGQKHDPATCVGCRLQADIAVEQEMMDALSQLFWAAVKASLPPEARIKLKGATHLVVCDGWKLAVYTDPEEVLKNQVTDLVLDGIMGRPDRPGVGLPPGLGAFLMAGAGAGLGRRPRD